MCIFLNIVPVVHLLISLVIGWLIFSIISVEKFDRIPGIFRCTEINFHIVQQHNKAISIISMHTYNSRTTVINVGKALQKTLANTTSHYAFQVLQMV